MKKTTLALIILTAAISLSGCGLFDNSSTAATREYTRIEDEVTTTVASDTPTDKPAEIITEAPTDSPVEAPTEVITEAPTDSPAEIPTEAPATKPDKQEEVTIPDTEESEAFEGETVMSKAEFAFKLHDGLMDFDAADGPYFIINLSTMKVVDCTSKNAKVVAYEKKGDILTITLYSAENPHNTTYVIDLTKGTNGSIAR